MAPSANLVIGWIEWILGPNEAVLWVDKMAPEQKMLHLKDIRTQPQLLNPRWLMLKMQAKQRYIAPEVCKHETLCKCCQCKSSTWTRNGDILLCEVQIPHETTGGGHLISNREQKDDQMWKRAHGLSLKKCPNKSFVAKLLLDIPEPMLLGEIKLSSELKLKELFKKLKEKTENVEGESSLVFLAVVMTKRG
ncbi:hypothetical protein C8J56DRAFT_884306 [Mycena floridula]|nr:hypothetical protein C8J56DRAFT_884306 [Mycena floridula]